MFLTKVFYCLAILILSTTLLMTGCGGSSSDSKPKGEQTQSAEKSSTPQPLGEHWIKDANDVYLWNPQPQDGETITWSGGFVQDGDYKFADGAGTTTWYLDGEVEQVDEGTFKHGQRHGHFTHEFPSGRIDYSNWDNGVEIVEPAPSTDDVEIAKQTFINYHKAITNKNYREAYDMLSYKQRERVGDFNSYVAGFADTLSSEVSDMKLTSSDEDSYTFDYTLAARDRHTGGNVKAQIFEGQVTMAKDKGRWFIRYAKSQRVDEKIVAEVENEQKARLAAEQKALEETVAQSSAGNELKAINVQSGGKSTKEYLESLQPFALANGVKKVTGIMGLFEEGSVKGLERYASAMMLLAQNENERNTPISREVALYFEYEAQIAAAHAYMENKGLLEKATTYAIIYKLEDEQEAVEDRINKTAKECGADLSNYAETEVLRRIVNVIKGL